MNTGSPQAAAASVRGALASACGQPCTIDVITQEHRTYEK
jgi:hypothetical protein